MVQSIESMVANPGDAAKEASDYIHKGLEHALYQEVSGDSIRSCRGKKSKAVDFFMRRKERCDKYVRESVAPDEEEKERVAAEEEAAKQKNIKSMQKGHVEVEHVAVEPLKGEIKLPPLLVNTKNNSSLAKPFGSQTTSNGNGWHSVNASSARVSQSMLNGDSMENSMFSTGASSNVFYDQFAQPAGKSYRPVAFMNFKPKQVGWREDGVHRNMNNGNNVNDILDMVRKREAEEEAAKAAANSQDEQESRKNLPNGVGPVRLAKVSLKDNIGKWRPTNDNWRPGVNTDGYFEALAEMNAKKH